MEEVKISKDADSINSIIKRYSEEARYNGKLFAVLIIVLSVLTECASILPFALCILYLILEYLYSVSISIVYKYILCEYFTSVDGGFVLNDGVNIDNISRKVAMYGSIQMIVNTVILILAFICLL